MALAFVRHSDGGNTANATTVATGAQTLTAGNLLVVSVRSAGLGITSCADTAGNTFTALTDYGFSGVEARIFYAANVTGHATNVVTATKVNDGYAAISADEFSGAALASVFDVEVGGTTTTTTLTSPALTTTNAADLVVVCGSQGTLTSYTAGSGYTLIDGTMGGGGNDYFGTEYKIVGSIISGVAQTIVSGASNDGVIAVASFKEAVAASRVPQPGAMLAAVHRASNF